MLRKRAISVVAVLALGGMLLGGCARHTPETRSPSPPYAAPLEPYEEARDLSCSYFQFSWAKSAELDGRLDEAAYAYRQALLCDRESQQIMRSLAMLLLRQDRREEAIALVRRIIELNPGDTAALSLLANLYSAVGQPEKAAAIYREVLEIEPGNTNVMLLLGTLYTANQRRDEAMALFGRLLEREPDFYMAHYYLARLHRDAGDVDAALSAYERALELNWSPAIAQEAAALYESEGLFDESMRLYRQMVAEDPRDERARGLLANTYLRLNRPEDALAELTELRRHIGDVDNLDLTIARILIDEERFPEALALLQGMMSDEPRLDAVRSLLVLAYHRQGRHAEARALLEEIRPGDYGYEEAVLMLARLYHGLDDPASAVRVLSRALEQPGDRHLSFYVTLALLHAQWQDAGQGIAVFERALRELGEKEKVLYEYAIYLDGIGDSRGALSRMLQVIELDPVNPYALNYVGYTWADRGENLQRAREYLEKAAELKPEDGAIRDSLGWVYFRLGDYRRAVDELEAAAELKSDDPLILHHLGDTHRKLGNRDEALGAYSRAMDLLDPEKEGEQLRLIEEKIEALLR